MTNQRREILSVVARVIAVICAIASVGLAIYSVMIGYAAATFDQDSLPGPAVLSMMAIGVALAALLSGGVAHVLWRVSNQLGTSARSTSG